MTSWYPLARQRLATVLEQDDEQIDLPYAALLIAQEEYPTLRPAAYLARLDELTERARQRAISPSPRDLIDAINEVLFAEEGFRGNSQSYYDPRNSFLNDVLDRKLGIPITLSIIYLAVARRLGLSVRGIGLPGHFIVGILEPEQTLVDPFNQGAFLTVAECAALVHQAFGNRIRFSQRMLAPVTNRQILARLLSNLKAIYAETDDFGRLLAVIDRLLLINPRDLHELRDRGAVCQQLKFYSQALADLERYVELAPQAPDVELVRKAVRSIRTELRWQN